MRLLPENKKGFTLLELVVLIAIVGTMAGVAILSLVPSRKHAALRAAQSELASAISVTQSYALQGRTNGERDVCGYGLEFINDTQYRIFFYRKVGAPLDCDHDDTSDNETIERSKPLSGGVRLSSPSGVPLSDFTRIQFDIPNGNLVKRTSIYTLSVSDGSASKTVTVSDRGLPEEGL